MILDATAGNRHIWDAKYDPRITFMDIEPELQIPPTILGDNTNTGFKDKSVRTTFYDPPHSWGATSGIYILKNHEESKAYWKKYDRPQYVRKTPGYYGLDKYRTKQDLLNHIGKAQNEFYRILEDDGMLWFKWCETKIPIKEVLGLFINWTVIMKIRCEHPFHGLGKREEGYKPPQTYWVLLMKSLVSEQQTLI
jgi:hypothetical protein